MTPKKKPQSLTLNEISEAVQDIHRDNPFLPIDLQYRKMTPAEEAQVKRTCMGLADNMGSPLYKIGTMVTDENGWRQFNEAIKERLAKK